MPDQVTPRYIAAVESLRALADAEGLDVISRAYAEVAQDLREREWMTFHGLTGEGDGRHWPPFLLDRPWVDRELQAFALRPAGFDHERIWLKDGHAVRLTSEPYVLGMVEVEDHLIRS